MATEAETPEPISDLKLEEDKEFETTVCSSSFGESQKVEGGHSPLPLAINSTKKEGSEVATDTENGTANLIAEDKVGIPEGECFSETPSLANVALEETCRASDNCKGKEKPIPNEQGTLENETQLQKDKINQSVEGAHDIKESDEVDDFAKQVTFDTSLDNARKEDDELAKASELPSKEKNVEEDMGKKLPFLTIIPTLVEKLDVDSREEVVKIIEATPGHNQEAPPLTPDLIEENLDADVRCVETIKNMELEACNKEESHEKNFNTNNIPIKQEVEETSFQEEGTDGKEQGKSSNFIRKDKDPETISPKEKIQIEKKEGDENPQDNFRGTHISTVMLNPKTQNGEDFSENEKITADNHDTPSVTMEMDERSLQKVKPEGGNPEDASSLALEEKSLEMDSSEKVNDKNTIEDEIQDENNLETPFVTQTTEETCFQKEDKLGKSEEVLELGSEDIGKESPNEAKTQNKILETIARAESAVSETGEENQYPETNIYTSPLRKDVECKRMKAETLTLSTTETSIEENKDKEGSPVLEAEDNNDNTEVVKARDEEVSEKSSQKDEPEVEKLDRSMDVLAAELETAASNVNAENDTCKKEEPVKKHEDSFEEETKGGETNNTDASIENKIQNEENLKSVDSNEKIGSAEAESPIKNANDLSVTHPLAEQTIQVGKKHVEVFDVEPEEQIHEENGAIPEEEKHIEEAFKVCNSTETALVEQETNTDDVGTSGLTLQTSEMGCVKLARIGELDSNEKLKDSNAKENREEERRNEEISDTVLHKNETECEDIEVRIIEKDGAIKNHNTVSLGDERVDQSCQEDEKKQNNIEEPASELKGEDQLYSTNDDDDTKPNGNPNADAPALVAEVAEEQIKEEISEKEEETNNKLDAASVTAVIEETSLREAKPDGEKVVDNSEEMSPTTPETSGTSLQGLDVEVVKLEEISNLGENARKEILTTEKTDVNEAEEEIKYEMPAGASDTVSKSEDQGIETTTETEIMAGKTPSDDKSEEKLLESSVLASEEQEPESIEAREKIKYETPVEDETKAENPETPLVAQTTEETPMQKEEPRKVEKVYIMGSKDIGKESPKEELQKEDGSELDKPPEIDPEKHISESKDADAILVRENTIELIEPSENSKTKTWRDEETLEPLNLESVEQNLEAVNQGDKLKGASESVAEDQIHETIPETEKIKIEDGEAIEEKDTVFVDDQMVKQSNHSEEDQKVSMNLEEAGPKLETEDHGDKINDANETTKNVIFNEEFPREVENADGNENIGKQIIEEESTAKDLYTVSVGDKTIREVQDSDLVSIELNSKPTESGEMTETVTLKDDEDLNKKPNASEASEVKNEVSKKLAEASNLASEMSEENIKEVLKEADPTTENLDTASAMVVTEETINSQEAEPVGKKLVEVSSIDLEKKSQETVETSDLVSQLHTAQCENTDQSLTVEKLEADKIEEEIKDEKSVTASDTVSESADRGLEAVAESEVTAAQAPTADKSEEKLQESSAFLSKVQELEMASVKNVSETQIAGSILDKGKITKLAEPSENSEKEVSVDEEALEIGLQKDEPECEGLKKPFDGVSEKLETGGARANTEKDVFEKDDLITNPDKSSEEDIKAGEIDSVHDTTENENTKEENAEAVLSEKIQTAGVENPNKNTDDLTITHSSVEETILEETGGKCEEASNLEFEKLKTTFDSVSEAQSQEILIETEKPEIEEDGGAVKDQDTVSARDETVAQIFQKDKKEDEHLKEAEPDLKVEEDQSEKTNKATETIENEIVNDKASEGLENFEKKIAEEEEAVKDYYLVCDHEKTVKESHEEDEKEGENIDEAAPKLETKDQVHELAAEGKRTEKGNEAGNKISDEEVSEGHENASASENIEKQILKEKGAVKNPNLVSVGEETIKGIHQKEENEGKMIKAATILEPEDQSDETNCRDDPPENDALNEEVKISDLVLVEQDLETTGSTDKIETVVIKDKEDQNMNLDASPAINAPAEEAAKEEVGDKLEKVSDLVPEGPIHEIIKTNEENQETEDTNVPKGLTEVEKHKNTSADLASNPSDVTEDLHPKHEKAPTNNPDASSLPEDSSEELQEKAGEVTGDEENHDLVSDKQAKTEVSLPTEEREGEQIEDEVTVEEILKKEGDKENSEINIQENICANKDRETQTPKQEETPVFLSVEQATAEKSITAGPEELDYTSNLVLDEQGHVKTAFVSEVQIHESEKTESTKLEGTDSLNEKLDDLSDIQPLGKEILEKAGTEELAEANEVPQNIERLQKASDATSNAQAPGEVDSIESAETKISTGSEDNSSMPEDPIGKTLQKYEVKDQKPGEASGIDSEVQGVEFGGEKINKDAAEETIEEPKPSDSDKVSISDRLQRSTKETLQMVGHFDEDGNPLAKKEELPTKEAPTIQVEEEKSNEEEKGDEDEKDEHKTVDMDSDPPVMVEASRDVDMKSTHKKSHNILSGVGSKVKHSIAKVKKAITGKSSHPKPSSPK